MASTFAQQAVVKGAIAIIAETDPPAGFSAPWIKVKDARLALAAYAAVFYGHPSDDLLVIGITGTNGKTTTSVHHRRDFRRSRRTLRPHRHRHLRHRRRGA